MKKGRNLSNYIIEGMYLDSTFGLTKACPPKEVQAQVNRSRIKSIKPPTNLKFSCDSFSLSDRYHFIGKFLKNLAVPVGVCFGKIAACYQRFTKTKMVRFWGMGSRYTDKFPKAFTARQLTIHHNQKLIPATERFNIFISLIFHYNSLKSLLWKKFDKLCKYIFPSKHSPSLTFVFKSMNSDRGHALFNIYCINSSYYRNIIIN